jgi:hypothetical protein
LTIFKCSAVKSKADTIIMFFGNQCVIISMSSAYSSVLYKSATSDIEVKFEL